METEVMKQALAENVAREILEYKIKENLKEIKKFWLNLKETKQIHRELRNIQKETGIDPETMTNFGAIILEPYAPEIFGKPKKEMNHMEQGQISWKVLLRYVNYNGIDILPKSKTRRKLGNVSAITGISIKRLNVFMNIFLKAVADETYPMPNELY